MTMPPPPPPASGSTEVASATELAEIPPPPRPTIQLSDLKRFTAIRMEVAAEVVPPHPYAALIDFAWAEMWNVWTAAATRLRPEGKAAAGWVMVAVGAGGDAGQAPSDHRADVATLARFYPHLPQVRDVIRDWSVLR